jgi:pyruvate dehydrogenase E2 component (dihydrolipoamide acetyltransferase)
MTQSTLTPFTLPSLGEGVTSADVAELLVKPGDTIRAGQIVAELETEKAVVELPCPIAGTVSEVRVSVGDTVNVGDLFLTVEEGAGASEEGVKASEATTTSSSNRETAKPHATRRAEREEGAPKVEVRTGETRKIDFQLPALGEGVESADVAEIHVKPGDTIRAEQIVMELETEKAVVELPCPFAGTIETLHVKAGDSVQVGQVLFTVLTQGADVGVPAPKSAAPAPPKTAPPQPQPVKSAPRKVEAELVSPAKPPAEKSQTALAATAPARAARVEPDGAGKPPVPASPSTRRLARQLGVDLRDVRGNGPGGRITREDVQAYVKGRLQTTTLPAVRTAPAATAGSLAPPPLPDFSRFGQVEREKLNKIARTAAENLTVAWHVIPHVTQHDRADVTELEAARKRFVAGIGQKGPKVTMTAIAIKALAKCLQAFPKFNSSLDPETFELVYKRYYHVGCAVDTPHGLIVPVIRDADRLSILQIAQQLAELAEQARERKLPLDAMQGATCTVTNLGGIGGVAFTPIVNYPEVCILGMSRTQTELRLNDGKVEERLMLPLALSYDHRVINGADAARFVATLCNMLSDPFQLLSAI